MSQPKQYVTVVATVEVPNDDLWDQKIAKAFQIVLDDLAEGHGVKAVGCDWEPDLDTVADAIADNGEAYGRISLVDLNPSRAEVAERARQQDGEPLPVGAPVPDLARRTELAQAYAAGRRDGYVEGVAAAERATGTDLPELQP